MHWQLRDSMRERTPSADDTPKRAPPAPPREASSADVVGGRGAGAEASPIARFSSPTANNTMVASTHNLGELVLGQYRFNTSERQFPEKNHHHYHHHNQQQQQQQQQQQYHHVYNHHYHNSNNNHNHHNFYNQYYQQQPTTCRSGQTEKDKRSRLSNVINNLRKKVPETNRSSCQSDERNSVERNLETLEKYVMTVLNGVIKDAETEGRGRADVVNTIDTEDTNRYNANSTKEDSGIVTKNDCNNPVVNHEPSEPSAIEPAMPDSDKNVDKSATETVKMVEDTLENNSDEISSIITTKNFDSPLNMVDVTSKHLDNDDTLMNIDDELLITANIGDKLNDDIRSICRDLLNDLLSDISQAIDIPTIAEKVETNCDESIIMTSLHCSLPLDKVAPVLPPLIEPQETMSNARIQTSPKSSPKSTTSPTVRHLCLYCDRKFLSISLRQRHTDRVHQLGGGRRSSERNSRKTIPSCQYCSDKYADNLEGLFQHMIACHTDKYHACTQCITRYSTREALLLHIRELHANCDRTSESLDRSKELVVVKEPLYSTRDAFIQNTRDIIQQQQQPQEKLESGDRRPNENEPSQPVITTPIKLNMFAHLPNKSKDISNQSSVDFDISFYSSVSCNIRENLLHHLDGKLQSNINNSLPLLDSKPQQHNHQLFHESANQIQRPIDISLTAATPVESKEYSASDNCDNTSEYAQKAGKMSRLYPRRIPFEKYNFPRKYDGKEQWTCSINDLSKFDIYTQLTLSKKQQMLKEKNYVERVLHLTSSPTKSGSNQTDSTTDSNEIETINSRLSEINDNVSANFSSDDNTKDELISKSDKNDVTMFSCDFGNFMRLRRWNEETSEENMKGEKLVYAELTGEWSRPRVYICGACTSRHLTLKEMEEHKIFAHPNVWCSHLEFTGDQRELYKHLFLPGRSVPTMKAKNAVLHEKVCTKCSKVCGTLAELHRHMLECGGDQAWLLGLFGNGKKKCKWRPFGSRSRRRRQRGMKRNISNSQATPRVNTPKEKAPSGPRVRPSDRESIQKMLANLPAKRSTRRVIEEASCRSRLRKVQTRSRPHLADNTTNTRLSRKTVLRNKLLKNAKSFQRKRCRGDNISAAIESVIVNYKLPDASKRTENKEENDDNNRIDDNKELKRKRQLDNSLPNNTTTSNAPKNVKPKKMVNRLRVVSKKRNVKIDTRRTNMKPSEKNAIQITEESSSSSSSSSSSTNNTHTKGVKVGLKRSTKDALNTGNSQSKARTSVPNAVSSLSTDNVAMRKRKSCDPLTSLNASIKAKSQLRSHDGKFIRNNSCNETTSGESSNANVQKVRTRTVRSDPGPLASRLRLRTTSRPTTELSKRITRVSTDSDKMPTLEPAHDGLMIDEKQDIEQPINDLPILSPAILAIRSCSKTSNNSATKQNDIKTRGKRGNISPKKVDKCDKQISSSDVSTIEKDVGGIEREVETKNRKSSRRRISINVEVDDLLQRHESLRESQPRDDNLDVNRKSFKSEQLLASCNKKNQTSKVVGTRKARQERRTGSLEELSQLQQVPLEVKKLLGPKDDLFTQIGITPTAKIRRNLRQLSQTPKHKINVTRKTNKLCNEDNNKDNVSNVDTMNDKCEKNILRKSPRIEKKDLTSDVELSGEFTNTHEINEMEECKPAAYNTDIGNQLTTGNSTHNNIPGESHRRGKLSVDADNTNSVAELASDFSEPPVDFVNFPPNNEDCETVEDQERDEDEDLESTSEDKEISSSTDIKNDDNMLSKDTLSVDSVSLNFEDLQQESNNSNIDSGKENSSETPANVSKPRATRPKKSRGLKRDRVVKRTLNNVIGILTEGVNIPVDVQQSVVLTVQTSVDNANSNNASQTNRIEIDDNSIAASNGGGANVDAIVIENNDDNCNTIHDSVVNDGRSESASQELQRCANLLIEAKEEAKLDVKQDMNIECSVSNVTTNNVVNIEQQEQLTNDIILDLSRRKPRGKGSFLEKIVSKIAKQKDALLEGEVGSLLDHAVDELSIILDEVGPALVDPTDAAKPSLSSTDSNDDKNDNTARENSVPVNEIAAGPMNINENLSSFTSEPFNNSSLELNTINDEILIESDKKFDNICSERNSKKRSLETLVETKNKRKSVEEKELEDNRIEEDLCLADIMKLINTAKRKSPIANELVSEKVRPGKRKIADKESDKSGHFKVEEETSNSLHIENDCKMSTIEMNKKSKRCDDRREGEKSDLRSDITRRSTSHQNESNDILLIKVADNELTTEKNGIGANNSVINKSNSDSVLECTTPSIENHQINIDPQITSPVINEKSSKSKKRLKKKSIVKELYLVENKLATELNAQPSDNKLTIQDDTPCVEASDKAPIQNDLIEDVTQDQVEATVEATSLSPKRSFKIPEVLEASQTTKKRGKKKSLANEHLAVVEVKIATAQADSSRNRNREDISKDESVLETSDVCNTSCNGTTDDNDATSETITVRSRRSSKRKNNELGGIQASTRSTKENKKFVEENSKKSDETLIERRKTLKRKAKENIFLLDDVIDFGDDMENSPAPSPSPSSPSPPPPPPPTEIKEDAITESSDKKMNSEISVDKVCIIEDNCLVELLDKSLEEKSENDLAISKSQISETGNDESENAATDDAAGRKKRGSGNFAVVHTKSGEILIVEKKKKFTKEAAKFFCNVCTTSFTRKSSLKKHNQSQSHLMQIAKCGNDQDILDESISIDETTVSSVDRSEMTNYESRQDLSIDTSKEKTAEEKIENIPEPKDIEEVVKEIADSSSQFIEILPAVEKPSSPILETPIVDSSFNCAQLEEDFEDELLDEEICKITENMTHDEYVLTDHVSPLPDGTSLSPSKDATDSLLESSETVEADQQKTNLADEHLDLESPIINSRVIQPEELIVDKLAGSLKNNPLILPEMKYGHETHGNFNEKLTGLFENRHEMPKIMSDNAKISLDFSNITEKLKINEFATNKQKSATVIDDFDSDEDLAATNMSHDIHKLLNETVLNIDQKMVENETGEDIDNHVETPPSIPCVDSLPNTKVEEEKIINEVKPPKKKKDRRADSNHIETSLWTSNRDIDSKETCESGRVKSSKSSEKSKISKSKSRMNKALKKKLADSDSEDDQEDSSSSQNKGKIVKSVFGRALTGEKIDKVKEVLDDWVSRSDSESRDETRPNSHINAWANWKDERRSKHEKSTSKSTSQRKKNNSSTVNATVTSSTEFNELSGNPRCRQSKKRAEERISRAFEEESIPYEFAYELERQTESIKNYKTSTIYNKEFPDNSLKPLDIKKSEDKTENDFVDKKNEENKKNISNVEKSRPEEFSFLDTNSMESIHTRVPSCPRERSSTPDMISLTTRDTDNDAENGTDLDNDEDNNENDNDNDDGDDDGDIVRGRLSPLYASNLAESSVDSVVSNSNENKSNRIECMEVTNKRRSSSEFSGEKIVIRSTVSSEEIHAGVVTIAPTDAIEDNALDVPQETQESTQKSRQGKVLNFDEELFVECCSRLKATTENELRGAKKIKLDHSEGGGSGGSYHDKVDQGAKTNRGRWRDTENQNSLGSLLESVNQLLGEEIYSNREHHRRERNLRCERMSPVIKVQTDFIRPENVGYEDSLDVAFEHNNKLRDKIQQRMRESENLIITSFSRAKDDNVNEDRHTSHHRHHHHHQHHHHHRHMRHHENIYNSNQRELDDRIFDENERDIENIKDGNQLYRRVSLESTTIKNKVDANLDENSTMPYLLDKALSSLFHNDAKHDHNGSTPMNVLAELACAQVPTSTHHDVKLSREKLSRLKTLSNDLNDSSLIIGVQQNVDKIDKDQPKKTRYPIKELFERKNEINDRKYHHERSHSFNSDKNCTTTKQKTKKTKRHNDFPLIKNNEFDNGLVERKKKRDDRKREATMQHRIKDIYDFDEEESQIEYAVNPAIPYRRKNEKNYDDMNNSKSKDITFGDLMTKTISKSLENGYCHSHTDKRSENITERKFQDIESVTPKTKGALKAYHVEEKRQSITGPMDEYIERRGRPRRTTEQSNKHKSKKRSKNSKKRSRTAWYENDSSDEFVTVIKSADIGVGISKSQRTCSKGKQNLFAELSTSSESEYEENGIVQQLNTRNINESRDRISPEIADNYPQEHENHSTENWLNVSSKTESKNDFDHKKSESDMSDHPLIIDERKDCDEQQNNSDDETDNRSEPAFELDDLYREDSSVMGSDCEENNTELPSINKVSDVHYNRDEDSGKNDLIPLEEALDLLDSAENIESNHDSVIESAMIPQTENVIVRDKFSECLDENGTECDEINVNGNNDGENLNIDDEQESMELPEKLSSNEEPESKASENLPLHVFLSRKVQESKKRKEQLKKMQEKEEESAMMEFQSTRRQRKCAIGKQGLLAEISSSDEEYYIKETVPTRRSTGDKTDNEKARRQKRESKEKKKERYMEKKHEQIIAKEQKAIEEEILRELELKKECNVKNDIKMEDIDKNIKDKDNVERSATGGAATIESDKKKSQRSRKNIEDSSNKDEVRTDKDDKFNSDMENKCNKVDVKVSRVDGVKKKIDRSPGSNSKKELHVTPTKHSKKVAKSCGKSSGNNRKSKNAHGERARSISRDDEELRTTKSWNKVAEGVGVAIGRRKRASTNQLYYWSSSSDDEEEFIQPMPVQEEEDDRQEQHGWIVGDSHKKMITMLAMEKKLKEKRRRSEDEFDSGKAKSKKHRNSTS